ncbi:MAG: SUMF1/EgtB/PvdO family nonheme iron enzyme, partial [Anaerolineales bacterium]|nr:SUMF1/EgtB/PvdO family nonheme iron enzyme [Anaerolineales bacterium]
RLALIIGNSEYDDPALARLVTPGGDAADLAAVLRDPQIGGFEAVETLLNQPLTKVRRAIAHFFARRKPDDLLLLYFSGHGVLDDRGRLFLALKDTEHEVLRGTALSANFITDEMDGSRSKRQVLILDCCHSGAFARGAKGAPGSSVGTAPNFAGTGYGRVVLTATDSTQYAWEGDQVTGEGLNSIFTRHLIHGLHSGKADTDQDGRVTLDEWYDYAYAQVISQTPKQTPHKWSFNEQGEIVVARNPHWRPPTLPPALQQALENPLKHVRLGAVRELGDLLRGSEKGLALAAKTALERLENDDSRTVSRAAAEILVGKEKTAPAETPKNDVSAVATRAKKIEVGKPAKAEPEKKAEPIPQPSPQPTPVSPSRPAVSGRASKRRTFNPLLISGAVVMVSCLLLVITRTIINMTASGTLDTSSLPETITNSKDSPMVLIPAGPFKMGSDADVALAECQELRIGSEDECQRSWSENEEPQHTVTLDTFYIDQHEVTNAQYEACVDDGGCKPPGNTASKTRPRYYNNRDFDDYPVIYVDWEKAKTYCDWRGARLPTEAEWEKAARGTDGRTYPWGKQTPNDKLLNFLSKEGDTKPAVSYPDGASPYGVYNMAGNVGEWVADWYFSDYHASSLEENPANQIPSTKRTVRGGGLSSGENGVRTAFRMGYDPTISTSNIGIRCAHSP